MLERTKTVFREAVADNITGEAAKVAFYLFLSLFPLILVLFGLTGFLGGDRAFEWIMSQMRLTVPGEASRFLERFVRQITNEERPGLLSVGVILLLWAASGGIAAMGDGLNAMFDIHETRSWVRKRLLALALLLAVSVLLTVGAALIVAGPEIFGGLGLAGWSWVLRWPLAFLLLLALFWILYYALPNRPQGGVKTECLIGAAVGAVGWLLVTGLFRLYVSNFASYAETYGFVGAVIVLLFWLYLTGVAVLFGGEVAATLEHGARERRTDPAGADASG